MYKKAFVNGNIITMDESKARTEAMLICGEKIEKVGSNNEIKSLTNKSTEIINLNGKTVVPGFIDSHTHFVSLGLSFSRVDLSQTKCLKDALKKVRQRRKKKNDWIIGVNFDESKWKERRFPTKKELDLISVTNPIVLRRMCGHIAVRLEKIIKGEIWGRVIAD